MIEIGIALYLIIATTFLVWLCRDNNNIIETFNIQRKLSIEIVFALYYFCVAYLWPITLPLAIKIGGRK